MTSKKTGYLLGALAGAGVMAAAVAGAGVRLPQAHADDKPQLIRASTAPIFAPPPGAPMSGFSARSGESPYELKEEIRLPVGFVIDTCPSVQVIVTGPAARRESINAPSAAVIATTGMVMTTGTSGVGATVGLMKPAALL